MTATISLVGGVGHLSVSKEDNTQTVLRDLSFTLAAGASREFVVGSGVTVSFMLLKSVLTSDPTTYSAVSYGVSDADGADPPNGTNWIVVDGVLVSWAKFAPSATYKVYVYNHTAASVDVRMMLGVS